MSIQLVIFDWAGTTVDFGSCAPTNAFQLAFAQRGVPVSDAEARGPMGTPKKVHLRQLLEDAGIRERWRATHGRPWTEAEFEAMYLELMPLQVEAIRRKTDLVPGLLECIATLRARGIKIGGSTGYFRAAADLVAQLAAAQGFAPDANVCADDVPAGRPAPWMVFRLMEQLNVFPPSAVLKVGDTVADIHEGKNAGVLSVGVVDSSSEVGLSADEFAALSAGEKATRRAKARRVFQEAGADAIINSLAELPALLT